MRPLHCQTRCSSGPLCDTRSVFVQLSTMNYRTQNGRTSKRGAFLNGIWHCDCEPRMPADKFQTKNGSKNHGRWCMCFWPSQQSLDSLTTVAVYTCQKPQLRRCAFFLWLDDAKVREESAVLNNSRSEPGQIPQTPRKPISNVQAPLTPQSRGHPQNGGRTLDLAVTPTAKGNFPTLSKEDSFEWPSSDEAELAQAAAQATVDPLPETPRKTPRTDQLTSPGKRNHSDMQASGTFTWSALTSSNDDDVFATPTTSNRSNGLLSPTATPAHVASQIEEQSQSLSNHKSYSQLATEALKVLAPIPLNSAVEAQLVALLNRHDLRTQGIAKGRDITRLAIQSKDKKIAELQTRIAGLEAERETSRTVIAHLKQDIGLNASSPKRGRGRFTLRNSSPGKT